MNEDRIVNIELKLTSQEDLVDTLNKMVYEQQKKIDELDALCTALVRRVVDMTASNEQNPINERPPHY
jgi:SlyX protein